VEVCAVWLTVSVIVLTEAAVLDISKDDPATLCIIVPVEGSAVDAPSPSVVEVFAVWLTVCFIVLTEAAVPDMSKDDPATLCVIILVEGSAVDTPSPSVVEVCAVWLTVSVIVLTEAALLDITKDDPATLCIIVPVEDSVAPALDAPSPTVVEVCTVWLTVSVIVLTEAAVLDISKDDPAILCIVVPVEDTAEPELDAPTATVAVVSAIALEVAEGDSVPELDGWMAAALDVAAVLLTSVTPPD